MAKRADEQEDPWAGFVDVLSNVVMVITFIIIILLIAMFVLASQVAKGMAEVMLIEELERRENESNTPTPDPGVASTTGGRDPDATDFTQNDGVAEAEATDSGGLAASIGVFRAVVERPILVEDEIEGETILTIRDRRPDEMTEHNVAATEQRQDEVEDGVIVDSANAMITLRYQPESYEIDPETMETLRADVASRNLQPTDRFQIRGFAASRIGSVSEARRIAFYRSMALRNVLLEYGVQAENIEVLVRESFSPEDSERVLLFLVE